MRFSAATANAHHIHYDWPYATRVEGYRGLVVQGPLMTMALAQTHRLIADGSAITGLTHRNAKPLFCADDPQLVYTATTRRRGSRTVGPGRDTAGAHTAVELTFA